MPISPDKFTKMERIQPLFTIEVLTCNTHVGSATLFKDAEGRTALDIAVNGDTSVVLAQEVTTIPARRRFRKQFKHDWWIVGPHLIPNRVGTFIALRKRDWEKPVSRRKIVSPHHHVEGVDPNMWPTREFTGAVALHKKSKRLFRISDIHTWFVPKDWDVATSNTVVCKGYRDQVAAHIDFHDTGGRRIIDVAGGDMNAFMAADAATYIEQEFKKIGMIPAHRVAHKGSLAVRIDDVFVSSGATVRSRRVLDLTDGPYRVDHPFVKVVLAFPALQ